MRNRVKDTAETPGVWITPEEGAMATGGVRGNVLGQDSSESSVETLLRAHLS